MAVSLAAVVPAMANDAATSETIEIITYLDYPPFLGEDLPNGGIYLDLVRESYRLAGAGISLKLMPWKRGLRALQAGRYPANMAWTLTDGRSEQFLYSKALFYSKNILLSSAPELASWHDILPQAKAGKTIVFCVPLGWGTSPILDQMIRDNHLPKTVPEKLDVCIEQLLFGRAHLINVMRLNALYFMHHAQLPDDAGVRPLMQIDGPDEDAFAEHMLFAKTEAGRHAKALFDAGFEKLVASGQYETIVRAQLSSYGDEDQQAVFDDLVTGGILPDPTQQPDR